MDLPPTRSTALIDQLPQPAAASRPGDSPPSPVAAPHQRQLEGGPVMARLAQVITAIVTAGIAVMVILPVGQTIVRRFGGDIPGNTSIVQHLTLWAGFLGAVLATLSGEHLSLSTVNLIPVGRLRTAAQV